MNKDFQLGKYFRLVVGNDWRFLSTPAVQVTLSEWSGSKGVTVRILGAVVSLVYYPHGDSHSYMFFTEFYEEDYCEDCANSESDYCDNCVEHVDFLTKDSVALRDIVG